MINADSFMDTNNVMDQFTKIKDSMFGEIAKIRKDHVATCMSDEDVLCHLLELENDDLNIYEFYSLVYAIKQNESFSAFRCGSLFKWYQIEQNEQYNKALLTFNQIREQHDKMKV